MSTRLLHTAYNICILACAALYKTVSICFLRHFSFFLLVILVAVPEAAFQRGAWPMNRTQSDKTRRTVATIECLGPLFFFQHFAENKKQINNLNTKTHAMKPHRTAPPPLRLFQLLTPLTPPNFIHLPSLHPKYTSSAFVSLQAMSRILPAANQLRAFSSHSRDLKKLTGWICFFS
ncbi:hypothetical protein BJ741DRAFT_398123 [Chytriomyces cf. hyalinus JEL632]|nr:hypothetical protein BJ741DRAFT_398123 [Chytriomyces cf. hyalinus JEL632]